MDILLLKQVSFLSAVLGAALGLLTLIPYLGGVTFFILMCLTSAIVIIFMYRMQLLEKLPIKDGITLGGVIGFISFLTFSIVYLPCLAILVKFVKIYPVNGISMMIGVGGFFVIIMFAIFIAILAATVNAFTAFVTFYGLEFFNSLKVNEKRDFQRDFMDTNYIDKNDDEFKL